MPKAMNCRLYSIICCQVAPPAVRIPDTGVCRLHGPRHTVGLGQLLQHQHDLPAGLGRLPTIRSCCGNQEDREAKEKNKTERKKVSRCMAGIKLQNSQWVCT